MWFIRPISIVSFIVSVSLIGQTSAAIPVGIGNGEMIEDDLTLTITYKTGDVDTKVFLALIHPNQLNCNINGVEDIFKLPGEAKWPLEWSVDDSGEVKVRLTKKQPGKWSKLETNPDQDNFKIYKRDFWPGFIREVTPATHDTYLVKLEFKENIFHYVPVGYQFQLKKDLDDDKIRDYAPVPLLPKEGEYHPDTWRKTDEKLNFLLKRYDGDKHNFSPWITSTSSIGSPIHISNVQGHFSNKNFIGKKDLYLYAAGTGISPMIGIILRALREKSLNIKLLYFNKTPEDTIWKQELENLDKQFEKFSIVNIYSDSKWSGYASYNGPKGFINKSTMESLMPIDKKTEQLVCMAGPPVFVEFVEDTLLIAFKYDQKNYNRLGRNSDKRSEIPKSIEEYQKRYPKQY